MQGKDNITIDFSLFFYCKNCMKIEMLVVMYVCVRGIDVA